MENLGRLDDSVDTLFELCEFPVRMYILGEERPHSGRGLPHGVTKDLTRNGGVNHRECTSSLEMGMCLTGNAILTGNGDVTHQECTSLPAMGM